MYHFIHESFSQFRENPTEIHRPKEIKSFCRLFHTPLIDYNKQTCRNLLSQQSSKMVALVLIHAQILILLNEIVFRHPKINIIISVISFSFSLNTLITSQEYKAEQTLSAASSCNEDKVFSSTIA